MREGRDVTGAIEEERRRTNSPRLRNIDADEAQNTQAIEAWDGQAVMGRRGNGRMSYLNR